KTEVLKVSIDGKEYAIPLGFSLKRKELAKLDKEAEVMKFFEKYLGKEVMDDLSIGELKQIIDAWAKATQAEANGGESLGE
ncbi:MAG: hypothetical protein IKD73_10950, partial [Selenomonadaceae bacterium]|nr:hypothetical protein [Selenomonadaceae bacterium]